MNVPAGLTPEQTRTFLQRQMNTGRYMILGTVIITVVNILMLLIRSDFYITYYSALAYCPVWLGMAMDNDFSQVWNQVGAFTWTGLLLAVLVLTALFVLWLLAKKDVRCFRVALVLLSVDFAARIAFIIFFGGNFAEHLWEIVIHGAVLWEMGRALSARKQLRKLPEVAEV